MDGFEPDVTRVYLGHVILLIWKEHVYLSY